MNPMSQAVQKVGLPAMRKVPAPPKANNTQPPATVTPELIQDIPVRNPIAASPGAAKPAAQINPISQAKPSAEPNNDDKDLESILKDVNRSVRRSENKIDEQFERLGGFRKKDAVKKAKINQPHNGTPPVIATAVACTVALVLIASATMAFSS